MPHVDALPFRIRVPGHDAIDSQGIVSISIKLEGILSVDRDLVSLEWTAKRQIESVSTDGIREEVDHSPVGTCDVPASILLDARLRGGWWAPRLELRASRIDAFGGLPTAEGGIAKLRIRRRDRDTARAICAAIETAKLLPVSADTDPPLLQG